MLANRLNIDKGFQIVDWHSTDLKDYYVTVFYADGTHASAWVDAETWNRIKEAEFRYNIEEANANRHEPIVAEQARRESFIALCRELDAVDLCAYCRSYVICGWDGSEFVLIILGDSEFEATRTTGESHGCCKQCHDGMVAACRDMKTARDGAEVKSEDVKEK
jgi:hypothetical protein